jgi:hypothetical protein
MYKIEYSAIDLTEKPMNDQTVHRQATRDAYEETPPHRIDHTLGDFAIPQSPFKYFSDIVDAMNKLTHESWRVLPRYISGLGDCYCLEPSHDMRIIPLWLDTSGGWHPEHKVGSNWLPDLVLLARLIVASKENFDDEESCGNYRREEVEFYAHPD